MPARGSGARRTPTDGTALALKGNQELGNSNHGHSLLAFLFAVYLMWIAADDLMALIGALKTMERTRREQRMAGETMKLMTRMTTKMVMTLRRRPAVHFVRRREQVQGNALRAAPNASPKATTRKEHMKWHGQGGLVVKVQHAHEELPHEGDCQKGSGNDRCPPVKRMTTATTIQPRAGLPRAAPTTQEAEVRDDAAAWEA